MPKENQKSSLGTLFILAMIILIVVAIRVGWLPWDSAHHANVSPIYDTDVENDRFIKGELTSAQLKLLDRILNEEQRNNQMRLSNDLVKQLAKNDRAVIEAYMRWRKCHDLMRTRHHIVYPNQR